MKNASLYFFLRVSLSQYNHEMLGFRKLLEKHVKWSETAVLSHLFAFNIKKVSPVDFLFFSFFFVFSNLI